MNERIKELAEQSLRRVESVNSYHSMVFDKEKFAELIIQECIAACGEDYGAQLVHQHWYKES